MTDLPTPPTQPTGTPAPATPNSSGVPSITPTPAVVSSKDMAGSFAGNVSQLHQMTSQGTPVVDTNTYTTTDPSSGATLYYKVVNGQVQYQNSPTATPGAPGITGTGDKTAVEKGAEKGAGS